MALNLTQVFTVLGRAGRNAYIMNGAQALQGVPFTELAGYAYVNPAWVAGLSQSYDALIRTAPAGMPAWGQAVQTVLQGLVAAQNPAYGTSLTGSLLYLVEAMQAAGASVAECTIGSTVTADTAPANVGTGVCVVTLKRGDGLIQQNTIAETSTLLITADSYTGGATAGREPWSWTGSPNASSLGTGTPVGLWDWDWPQGSGGGAGGQCVSASQDASTTGNLLTNGDFESWTGSAPAVLDYWHLAPGAWGTSVQRSGSTDGIDGGYCVQFNAGATLNALTQQFDSAVSDGTDATAGTTAAVNAYSSYLGNFWLKAGGVISGGVLTVSLVDGAGTVINDAQGTANSQTYALTAHSTSWTAHNFNFRLPYILPAVVRLKFAITTALAGATLLWDYPAYTPPTPAYPGGFGMAVFSNPASPFEAAPDPDGFSIVTTNNRAGATYGATMQTLVNRLFQQSGLLLPYSGAPTILDTLITGV